MLNSFDTRTQLKVGAQKYHIHSLQRLAQHYCIDALPYSMKVLLENLLRNENGEDVTKEQIAAVASWDPAFEAEIEIGFSPARVLMQDLTGVPAVVDLAAMRDALSDIGHDPRAINPIIRTDLVIDHSVMVDHHGSNKAISLNSVLEYRRNFERYSFLRWGQNSFTNFSVVPPSTGIVHQVNLEYLASVVFTKSVDGATEAYPDTVVGMDSHTTMINGIGVLGWGVGGIEAEAAMLGQSTAMLLPKIVGMELCGCLPEGTTSTDLVLSIVQILRKHGVVGKIVEFFGDGLDNLTVSDQATIANMAPEYGATSGIFPIDSDTLEYLRLTGRSEKQVALVEAYARHQGMFRESGSQEQHKYTETLRLDLSSIVPSIAGPKRPQDRLTLREASSNVKQHIAQVRSGGIKSAQVNFESGAQQMSDGDVVVAAITSCTNTSNPAVIMAAGLLAQNAVEAGLSIKPWVKTSLAPGSQVVTEYLTKSGLLEPLEKLGFSVVGYGCTTCIGNSGPLPEEVASSIKSDDLMVCSVLSGNRNFEGRVHPLVKMNFLASPPLVVAYALAGSMNVDLYNDPIGVASDGSDVMLHDIWPTNKQIETMIRDVIDDSMFTSKYVDVFKGDSNWETIPVSVSGCYDWQEDSTYIRKPPFFENMGRPVDKLEQIHGARALAVLGDSITTDHISPAGSIMPDSPAGKYLVEHGVNAGEFNSYGSRRGNHEVMMRGTFANIRLRNEMAEGKEGGWTRHMPSGEVMSIYDASVEYSKQRVPLIIIAGKEYGSGSSRDWAAKGPLLLGVKAVIVESFERIHRSNLVGMGILPLEFMPGESRQSHKLTGGEVYHVSGIEMGAKEVEITASRNDGTHEKFSAVVRIDTPREWTYYANKGVLRYVVRHLAGSQVEAA